MPMYQHKCECGHEDSYFRPMAESKEVPDCPVCGQPMPRNFHAEGAGPHLDKPFQKPIEMHSIALNHPDDIKAFKQRNPDVEVKDGVPIAHTRKEKLRILDREGFMEKN